MFSHLEFGCLQQTKHCSLTIQTSKNRLGVLCRLARQSHQCLDKSTYSSGRHWYTRAGSPTQTVYQNETFILVSKTSAELVFT